METQAKPSISYLSPSSYSPSVFSTGEITIGGDNFGDRKGSVRFGNTEATILSWSNGIIIVEVPDIGRNDVGYITDSTYMVVVENDVGTSNSMAFEIVEPESLVKEWDAELPEELP